MHRNVTAEPSELFASAAGSFAQPSKNVFTALILVCITSESTFNGLKYLSNSSIMTTVLI